MSRAALLSAGLVALMLVLLWAAFGFVAWNWNPHAWPAEGRGLFAFVAAFTGVLVAPVPFWLEP